MNFLPTDSIRAPLHRRAAIYVFDIFCRSADCSQFQEMNENTLLKTNAVKMLPVLKTQAPVFSHYLLILRILILIFSLFIGVLCVLYANNALSHFCCGVKDTDVHKDTRLPFKASEVPKHFYWF